MHSSVYEMINEKRHRVMTYGFISSLTVFADRLSFGLHGCIFIPKTCGYISVTRAVERKYNYLSVLKYVRIPPPFVQTTSTESDKYHVPLHLQNR